MSVDPTTRPGLRRDTGRVEHILSVTSDLVRPSPALCPHLGHCGAIPGAMEPCFDEAPPRWALCNTGTSVSEPLKLAYGLRPGA
jgi:hypothetical protein